MFRNLLNGLSMAVVLGAAVGDTARAHDVREETHPCDFVCTQDCPSEAQGDALCASLATNCIAMWQCLGLGNLDCLATQAETQCMIFDP